MIKKWEDRVALLPYLKLGMLLLDRDKTIAMQAEIDELRAKLAALELQEPVMWAYQYADGTWRDASSTEHSAGMKGLYAAAGAAPVPRMTGAALASQEPVAEVLLVDGEKVIDASMAFFDSVELGTKLYLAAGAAPVPRMTGAGIRTEVKP